MQQAVEKLQWNRRRLIENTVLRRLLKAGLIVYIIFGVLAIDVNWVRVFSGFERLSRFVVAFFTPDFTSRSGDIINGVFESLGMTAVATIFGVVIGLPFGFGAAKNISCRPVYLFCRAFIILSRSFTEIIIAIIFVVLVGFGPFAGVLTLTVSGAGFMGKLIGEEIEAMNPEQLEAIRATGASWWLTLVYAVWPQIKPRVIGLSLYRMDINFRNSTVLGIVGAGGIGSTLTIAYDRYEYSVGAAILLIIVALVLIAEYISGLIRQRVQ